MNASMKKIAVVLALALLAAVPTLRADDLGAALTLDETLPIPLLLAHPDQYVGKKVRVEGTVTEVCQMKGCWMEIEEGPEAKIRIKVEDGVIVFPATATGKKAIAEGVVESVPMTRESYVAWREHEAEDRGVKFDPATVGDGPFRILELRGVGARISGK
jgi:Domain of unknown function (DUF4920)